MGFAIIQINSEHPEGRVTWMQEGRKAPSLRDEKEEKLYRIPDRLVTVSRKTREVAGSKIPYFDAAVETVTNVGLSTDIRIEEFAAEYRNSTLFGNTAQDLRFMAVINSVMVTDNFESLDNELSRYFEQLSSELQAEFSAMAKRWNVPIPANQSEGQAGSADIS